MKKLTTLLLVMTIMLAQFSWVSFSSVSYAAGGKELPTTVATQYFGNQLNQPGKNETEEKAAIRKDAAKFYDVMVGMYNDGTFERGEDCDLVTKNVVTQEQLQAYATGSQSLLYSMATARDAFQYDYPDAFWIDFSAISLRVTLDTAGVYHAYLGAGKRDDYLMPGYTKTNIAQSRQSYESKLEEVVEYVKTETAKKVSEAQGSAAYNEEAAKIAHDWVTKNMIYKYEHQVTTASNARTAYDCLIYGEGVCESYTRGYKAIMDRLGIPCICVYGVYRVSDTQDEEHIWNYVQIDGKWYGVDCTMDDPVVKTSNSKNSSKETREYLLVGETDMNARHYSTGVLSDANYEFEYPVTEQGPIGGEEWFNSGKFQVRAFGVDYTEGAMYAGESGEAIDTQGVQVAYEGRNYTENAARGIYMLARFGEYDDEKNEWNYTEWGYITPEIYDPSGDILEGKRDAQGNLTDPNIWKKDGKTVQYTDADGTTHDAHYVYFPMPHLALIQFAVTNIAPKYATAEDVLKGGLYYSGDTSLLSEKTPEILNTHELYVAPPYVKEATPRQYVKLNFGGTYNMRVEYTEALVPEEGKTEADAKLVLYSAISAMGGERPDAIEESKIEDVQYEKNDKGIIAVTFKFTPDAHFSSNEVVYSFRLENLVGVKSNKKPNNMVWGVGNIYCPYVFKSSGIDFNTYAQPVLLGGSELDPGQWTTKDMETGEETVGEFTKEDLVKLSNRLALVTKETSDEKRDQMMDKIEEKQEYKDDKIIEDETKTYDIIFQVCKKAIAKTGQKVRVCLGFPQGTTYEQYLNGTKEFKIYHYIQNDDGSIRDVEDIPVEVTPQGLIILVDSFSPFTVATLEGDGTPVTKKNVILSGTEGGTVTCGDKTDITMEAGQSITVKVQPKTGYVIESLTIGDTVKFLTEEERKGVEITINESDLPAGGTKVYAKFMSAKVEQADADRNETEVETPVDKYEMHKGENGVNFIDRVPMGETVEAMLASLDTEYTDVTIKDKNGNDVTTGKVGTGMKVRLNFVNKPDVDVVEYEIVIWGDLTGDGEMTSEDFVNWRRNDLAESTILSHAELRAADFNNDGVLDSADAVEMRRADIL